MHTTQIKAYTQVYTHQKLQKSRTPTNVPYKLAAHSPCCTRQPRREVVKTSWHGGHGRSEGSAVGTSRVNARASAERRAGSGGQRSGRAAHIVTRAGVAADGWLKGLAAVLGGFWEVRWDKRVQMSWEIQVLEVISAVTLYSRLCLCMCACRYLVAGPKDQLSPFPPHSLFISRAQGHLHDQTLTLLTPTPKHRRTHTPAKASPVRSSHKQRRSCSSIGCRVCWWSWNLH